MGTVKNLTKAQSKMERVHNQYIKGCTCCYICPSLSLSVSLTPPLLVSFTSEAAVGGPRDYEFDVEGKRGRDIDGICLCLSVCLSVYLFVLCSQVFICK